jgi:radical SAM protein with 4Fe4S-binding SPASM domain
LQLLETWKVRDFLWNWVIIVYEKPLEATLLLTHQCNLSCLHCWGTFGKPRADELSTTEWIAVFDELVESGILYLSLNGGEPFCRPDIEHLINHLEEIGLHYMIFTNGLLINENMARKLSKLNFLTQIRLSVDGASSKSHETLRIFPDGHPHNAFKKVVHTMELLHEYDVDFTVNTVLFKENITELESMSSLLNNYGAREWHIDNLGDLGRGLLHYEELQVSSIPPHIFRPLSRLSFPVDYPPETPVYKGDCTAGRNKVTIDADGAVLWCPLCTLMDYPFVNIKEVPLLTQWRGEHFDMIRHYVETPSQFCAECQYHESCDGCPVISYMYFSRFDLPPPDCFFKLDLLGLKEKVSNLSFYLDQIKRKEHEFRKRYSQL